MCDKDTSPNKRNDNPNIPGIKLEAFWGLFYLILHVISVQFISVIVKKVSYISICQLSLIRYAGIFAASISLSVYCTRQILGEKRYRFLIVLRALLAANGLYLQIIAYRYLQLVEASIVMSTYPFVTAIIARVLLKEPLGLVQTITLITTICGVLMSLRLPEMLSSRTQTDFDVPHIIGLLTAIGSVLCLSLSTVAIRKLQRVHYSIMMLYMSFLGMIENAVLNATVFPLVQIKCGWDVMLCILVGVFGIGSDCFLTLAVQVEPAGLVAIQKSSLDILITAVFQILFFSTYPDVYVIAGAILVVASLTAIGVKKWILTLPETSNIRQKLKCFLS